MRGQVGNEYISSVFDLCMAFIFFLIIKVVENIFDNMANMGILYNEASDILSANCVGGFFWGGGFFPFNLFFLIYCIGF